ncbi:TetR/AcrR family transcriptional regulator [Spongiactinospora gelatinilytica]|uniref:TetR/AcrR family transcriptional regulator n=1 Tax=Spongiactinospora gelatinilytica TaxID=2666298 RepID=A0A2W2G0F1_9ACTN|nr:TetR/AcrR family transcriptional regulator [Spongiactinospora gelatinilytica]PZG41423.1 TetR/AcrR family transcriptional regulator [Spongiactinospora gelatinilytica]
MGMVRTGPQTPGRRQRSEGKRTDILAAATALFVSDGYELTSVDAIAARAKVSKRTVYDHFGDKQALFLSVLVRVNEAVVATVRAAIDQELTEGRDLREALTAFAMRVATEAFPSSDYVTFRRLTSHAWPTPPVPASAHEQPERILEDRFAKLARDGEIRAGDPHWAARHFTALTILLALDALRDDPAGADIPAIVANGVEAFLRAYR